MSSTHRSIIYYYCTTTIIIMTYYYYHKPTLIVILLADMPYGINNKLVSSVFIVLRSITFWYRASACYKYKHILIM